MQRVSPSSNAKAYFDLIKGEADPFAFLANIPSRPEPFFEEEWIDFKSQPQNDGDAKKIWSKALSGYANITDGLIVWGIDARKTEPRQIDAASALKLVQDPEAFESKLRDWIRDATNPPVMGVQYESYAGPSGEGFVVCLVPESSHKPHRAEFAGQHYYYRAGDDFLIAQPGLLRILFYPQLHPYLWIEATLSYDLTPADAGTEYRKQQTTELYNVLIKSVSAMQLQVRLQNSGVATAKDAYVVLQTSEKLRIYEGDDWARSSNPQGSRAFYAKRPFHPGDSTILFTGSYEKRFRNITLKPSNDWSIIPHFDKLRFEFLIHAEGTQRQIVAVEFIPEDLSFESGSATKQALPEL
jgi:hypothetical protein